MDVDSRNAANVANDPDVKQAEMLKMSIGLEFWKFHGV